MIPAHELLRFPLFSSLKTEDLTPLLPHLRQQNFRKGQILFTEGEMGSHVYFVLSGQIKLTKTLVDGDEQILDWYGPNTSIAEELLLESGSYSASAEVAADSTLLILNNKTMPEMVKNNPAIALALIRNLSKRLRLSQEFIRILTSRSIAGILATLLLRLARPAHEPGQPIYVDATLTHRDLASMIGTSREVVNRTLSIWKKAGIISLREDRLEILKPYELADWP